jgi:hypothetical protein
LTIASCTTIHVRITRDPAAKVIKSSPVKEQALNQTRTGDRPAYPRGPTTTWRWSPAAATLPRVPLEAGS